MNSRIAARWLLCVMLAGLAGSMVSCKSTPKGPLAVTDGMKVTMTMTVALPDRTVVSFGKKPTSFIQGTHENWPGLEMAVAGMKPGEKKTITLMAEEAAGPYDESKRHTVKLEHLPLGTKVGTKVRSKENGMIARVVKISGDEAVIDSNNEFAGKDLVVSVTILKVEKP